MRNGGPASTFFAGREAELARLEEALRSAPIAIVSGLPGVGKTAVAARLAARIEENRKLPLLWVQATEEGDLLEKIDAALRARGIEELSPYMARGELSHQERWMTLCAILRRCPSLLAIDDVHALGLQEAAELLRLLAVHLGPSRAIATTRVRLQTGLVEGVQSIELVLEGLPGAEAAAMLSELLGGAPSSGPQLLRLAEALGGHPLSLRLAASALAEEGMTPLELLEQTSPRREELGREMLERVHTSLSLAERRLLSALSVFREPAAPEAVSALVGPEVLELAGRLEDRFVAGRRANGRLDLHPLIREHALARLPETERDRLRLDLSRWYEAQAAEAEDLEALVEAQHHAAAAGEDGRAYQLLLRVLDRLLLRGRYRELGPMLDRALATIYEPDVRLALAKARLLRNQGRPAEARHLLAEMTAREDPRERAMVLAEQALLEQDAGRYEKALKLYYQALESARADDDLGQSAKLLARIATICKDRGEYARAVKMYEQAADLERKHGTVDGVAFTLHNLAKIHYFQGDHEKAMAAHMEALEMWEGAGDRLSALLARNGVANILRDRGLVQQAEETYEKNLAEYRALANPFGESYTLANLA
ncbi:MAG: tetratricopeptide repeat protein, partial [Candidatus Wallbacteria bacterium]|nr:tetratricopeptide repeat protein [Candidatus Wallbacteria bacterium]